MKPFWIAIRPMTLIASISPIVCGTVMALTKGFFSLWVLVFTLLCGMGIQMSCNVANDLFDFLKGSDTKKRKGPVRVTASGLMSIVRVKLLTFALMLFTAGSGAFLIHRGGILIAFLVATALILAIAYTSGPFPIAYSGLGEFFILIFFGPVASGITYYLQTLEFSAPSFWAGLSPGMISCGILIINNLRDVHEDREAKKNTLVVRFGTGFGKWEYAFFIVVGSLIPLSIAPYYPMVILSSICIVPAYKLSRKVFSASSPQEYSFLFSKTTFLLLLYTITFSLGIFL